MREFQCHVSCLKQSHYHMRIDNKEQLQRLLEDGVEVEYIFFWGPGERGYVVGPSCLCQWYYAPFEIDGVTYITAEHYMMAEKARLFEDEEVRQRIIDAPEPFDAKMLGRHVRGFDDLVWQAQRFDIVFSGSIAKFSQNPELKQFLLQSGETVLVEASPIDSIWGVGLSEDDPDIRNPSRWKGMNLLGFALIQAREVLRNGIEAV